MAKAQSLQLTSCSILLLVTTLFCPAVSLLGQEPTPKPAPDDVIRVETNLVQIRTVVTDRSGHAVDNLPQEDFEVLENGRPQKISFFELDRTGPGRAGAAKSNDQPIELNGGASKSKKPSRSIVILVDTLHLTPVSVMRTKESLKKFIDRQLTDDDLVAIVTSSFGLGLL